MRTKRFSLKHPRIRMSMNKYNLYNLTRLRIITSFPTYFQQKWKAKSAGRAYHGEHIREKQWERMFTSRIKSVIPMNHRYLAVSDGSEQAAGRGSGHETQADPTNTSKGKNIPYMNMTFAPIERRLDTAIFRALFASSSRQARQFVIHGAVKVNGKKMIYPGYLLNPGDMFQVEPDRVLYATGAPKGSLENQTVRSQRRRIAKVKAPADAGEAGAGETEGKEEAGKEEATKAAVEPADEAAAEKEKRKQHKDSLKSLLTNARELIDSGNEEASAKKKQKIRAFAATVRRAIGNANRTATENLDDTISELVGKLSIADGKPAPKESAEDPSVQAQLNAQSESNKSAKNIKPMEKQTLEMALREIRENPIDASKPYATPWKPREFMSAFAFIPRYLEVNHNICSAVYVRHPVARPRIAEVPTPFPIDMGALAYNWYLRRR